MSIDAITSTLFPAPGSSSASRSGDFAASMSTAAGSTSPAAATVSNPFGRMGTDLQSLLLQLGGGSGAPVKDASATTASANSTAALHGQAHHHHDRKANQSSGDLVTDFANNTLN